MSKGEQTKQSVLDQATRLASRVGVEGMTISGLATHAELSKSGLFAHFKSKEALQIAVLEHAAGLFRERVVHPALAAPRGEIRLRTMFRCWLGWATDLPGGCVFVASSAEFDDRPGPVRDALVRAQRDWFEALATMFRGGVTDGQFAPDADADQFVQDLYGVLLGYHHMSRLVGDPDAERRAWNAFTALLDAVRV